MSLPDTVPVESDGQAEVLTVRPAESRDYERIPSLDLIRGVTILGILLINISFFMAPSPGFSPHVPDSWWGDYVVKAFNLLIEGKMMSQLAMLFGAGLALQADRARAAGRPFTAYYLRRQGLLFLLGISHALLLWYGDILASYAIVGAIALFLSRLGQRGILWSLAGCLAWVYGWLLVFVVGMVVVFLVRGGGDATPDIAQPPAARVEEQGANPSAEQALERLKEKAPRLSALITRIKSYWGEENELRIYRDGPWSAMVANRALQTTFYAILFGFLFAWLYLACFLIGIYITRRGVFYDFEGRRPFLRRLALFGFGVGGTLHLVALGLYIWHLCTGPTRSAESAPAVAAQMLVQFGVIPLAIGYLVALLYWSHSGRAEWLQKRFQAVGRMALTNYIMQSVLCGLIFYSYGLGLFGQFGHTAGLGVVIGIWLLQLTWSPIWLKYFRMGPVEWAWRSLADGHRKPFLRTAPAPAA
jgi:uncharacterized protein